MHLVVISPFGKWERGDVIADADDIDLALEDHGTCVVAVASDLLPAAPEPEPEPDAKE